MKGYLYQKYQSTTTNNMTEMLIYFFMESPNQMEKKRLKNSRRHQHRTSKSNQSTSREVTVWDHQKPLEINQDLLLLVSERKTLRWTYFKKKSQLKGVKLLLTENLTKWRQSLFTSAKDILGIRKVWTNEGRIFTKVNDRIKEIRSLSDIPR